MHGTVSIHIMIFADEDKPHRPDEALKDTHFQRATSLDAQIQGIDQQEDERRYPLQDQCARRSKDVCGSKI